MTDNQPAEGPRKIDAAEVAEAIAQSPYRRVGIERHDIVAGLRTDRWREEVDRLQFELSTTRRNLAACRSELASIAILLQERRLLPDLGGENLALVAGAVSQYVLNLETQFDLLEEQLKETRFLRAEETDDLRTTVAMLWDLMTDDQCIRFSAISPLRYGTVQDLWRKWADRQGER